MNQCDEFPVILLPCNCAFLSQILEPRFTAESLAALLSIPTSKTLLRRHLATHFQSLVGNECHQVKEEAAADPMFQPLMPGIKHKVATAMHDFIIITITITSSFEDRSDFSSSYVLWTRSGRLCLFIFKSLRSPSFSS